MNIKQKTVISATLILGVSCYGIVQANHSFGDLIPESQDVLKSIKLKQAFDNLQEDYKPASFVKLNELDLFKDLPKPAQHHMVTRKISLSEIQRANHMVDIAYEGYDSDIKRVKTQALINDHQNIIRENSNYSDSQINTKAKSRVHFFGQTRDKDGCVIEDVDGTVYVSYRGTMGLNPLNKEWRNNYKAAPRESRIAPKLVDETGAKVLFHSGFLNRAENTFSEVTSILENIAAQRGQKVKDLSITVTGHSKGAGIAQDVSLLLAHKFETRKIKTITFAPPRSVNHAGARLYNQLLDSDNNVSVMQSYDLVTAVSPGFTGFKHISDENRLYVPRMGLMHMISDYEQGLKLIEYLRNSNYVLKDDMGNIYTGQGDEGRGNALKRGLRNLATRTINLLTGNKMINYTAVPVNKDSLLTQSYFNNTLPKEFDFVQYSSTPYEVTYKSVPSQAGAEPDIKTPSKVKVAPEQTTLTVKAPAEKPAAAPARQSFWGRLKSKVLG